MSTRSIALTSAALLGVAAAGGIRRHRHDRIAAQARLDAVERRSISTSFGTVEYADCSAGTPMLVSHGIFQGCDGALLSVRGLTEGHRIIAPSRFGYLGSALPSEATPADQADAFAAVLDHLSIEAADVVGISAGATAALQLALRHPDRVSHLVIISGNLPGATTAVAQPSWARYVNRDLPMWLLRTVSRNVLARLAGVPATYRASPDDQRFIDEFLDSLFPMDLKAAGVDFDAFISNPDVNTYPLEQLGVPTLIIHARDDPLVAYEAAVDAADRIPHAALVTLPSGGHLGLGQTERIRNEVDSFLGERAAV
jgi:pimeloyl-ACP methyl ester carboxylesterase